MLGEWATLRASVSRYQPGAAAVGATEGRMRFCMLHVFGGNVYFS